MIDAAAKSSTGFTLIEALLAAVVLAMAVAAIIMPFAAGAQATARDARTTLAVNLAQDMMEEILAKEFRDPGGGVETGRSDWDNIADYHGYVEPAGAIRSFDGVGIDDPASVGLSRHVTVEPVYVSGQDTSEDPTFLRVIVEMHYHGTSLLRLTRLVYANE